MEDDGFTIVKGKRAARKVENFELTSDGKHRRINGTDKEIENAMDFHMKSKNISRLWAWMLKRLEYLLENRRISHIIVIGNGHFDGKHQAGAAQLALCMKIKEHFGATMVFQEPECTEEEKSWISSNSILLRSDLDMKFEVSSDNDESLTLLVMIHGAHQFLNEFLEFNWTPEKLKNLIIIGNDYRWENKFNNKIDEWVPLAEHIKLNEACNKDDYEFHGTALMWLKR